MKLCDEKVCFGCHACSNICPRDAISFHENDIGALLPIVRTEKCINCGLCEKVCPALHLPDGDDPKKCFAAWSSNSNILKNAASGGIASVLYDYYIEHGGICFGAGYYNQNLCIAGTNSATEIKSFAGSKYIHADAGSSYKQIKKFLIDGTQVVFVGTPCQIAAVKSYLNKDYENLLLVDIVCHGVSPQSFLKEYVSYVTKTNYDRALFRGEKGNSLAVYKNEELIYCREKWFDPYSMAYARGLLNRENCYSCPFASNSRQGDITIGDFWGLDKSNLSTDATQIPFVSLVLVNTNRGDRAFEKIKEKLIYEERSVSEAISGNKQFNEPCNRHVERDDFLINYKEFGLMKALKKTQLYKRTVKNYNMKIVKTPFRIMKRLMNGGN